MSTGTEPRYQGTIVRRVKADSSHGFTLNPEFVPPQLKGIQLKIEAPNAPKSIIECMVSYELVRRDAYEIGLLATLTKYGAADTSAFIETYELQDILDKDIESSHSEAIEINNRINEERKTSDFLGRLKKKQKREDSRERRVNRKYQEGLKEAGQMSDKELFLSYLLTDNIKNMRRDLGYGPRFLFRDYNVTVRDLANVLNIEVGPRGRISEEVRENVAERLGISVKRLDSYFK